MKRFLAVILVIWICIGNIFAIPPDTSVRSGGADTPIGTIATAYAKVVLDLSKADISGYRFGFSSDDPVGWGEDMSLDTLPTPLVNGSDIALTFDATTGKATNAKPFYVYYKTRTVETYDIEVSIANPLTGSNDTLDWTVAIGEEATLDSGGSPTCWKKTVAYDANTDFLKYGIYPITVETYVIPNNIKDDTYSGEIKLSITPA